MAEYTPKHNDAEKTTVPVASADDTKAKRIAPSSKKNSGIYIAIVAVVLVLAIVGGLFMSGVFSNGKGSADGHPELFKGLWRIDSVTSYSFDGLSKGVMYTAVQDYPFTYGVRDDHIYIDYVDEGATDSSFTYSFKGATLTLSRWGVDYVMTKDS